MAKLTIKQQKFCDEYIITGNATEAARRAGYSQKTANRIATENLSKLVIQEYIAEQTKGILEAKKMDLEEAIRLSSEIARGEVQKGYSKQYDRMTGKVIKEVDYEYTPSIEDRQKSLEHIIKINGGFLERKEINGNIGVTIVDDIDE